MPLAPKPSQDRSCQVEAALFAHGLENKDDECRVGVDEQPDALLSLNLPLFEAHEAQAQLEQVVTLFELQQMMTLTKVKLLIDSQSEAQPLHDVT